MTPPKRSRFLTIWFTLDAIHNAAYGIVWPFLPAVFFTGAGSLFGDDVILPLPVTWIVRAEASSFILASGAEVVAARSRVPGLRRWVMIALLLPGVVQIPSAIVRGKGKGGDWQAEVIALVVTCVISAPYVFFTLIKHEETTEGARWKSKLHPDRAQAVSQRL